MTAGRGALIATAAAATGALDLLAHPHGDTWWHHLAGFDLVYGFLVVCPKNDFTLADLL